MTDIFLTSNCAQDVFQINYILEITVLGQYKNIFTIFFVNFAKNFISREYHNFFS